MSDTGSGDGGYGDNYENVPDSYDQYPARVDAEEPPAAPSRVISSRTAPPERPAGGFSESRREAAQAEPQPQADTAGEMQPGYWATPDGASHEPIATVALGEVECRVLGALIEKSFLTPDVYPMTTNGLVTACNQKTNRDPVVNYNAVTIDGSLLELRKLNLVRRVHAPGSRSTKHRHTLDEALTLDDNELAVMSVLMLRGPQTVGELRLRTERHVAFDSLEATDACLTGLADRPVPLVVQLARKPGHKEARWQHLIADGDAPTSEADTEAISEPAVGDVAPAAAAPAGPGVTSRVEQLEAQVATLQRQLSALAEQLGATLDH